MRRKAKPILQPDTPARMRLAYDELLANQLALTLIRAHMRAAKGRALKGDGHLKAKAIAALPFALTEAQNARACRNRSRHGRTRRACCGCCRAMSAPAKPSSRCWRCSTPSKRARKAR